MKLSIVATLYNSESSIEEFFLRASQAAEQLVANDYEIILVNDGSPDKSLDRAKSISEKNSHLMLIDLSRNFGHHKAMMTGLAHATGERIFLIDSDLEEEPEWLSTFSNIMNVKQCDVVYGVQDERKGSFVERKAGQMFYNIFRKLTGLQLPANMVVARLMSKRYVRSLLQYQEREIFLAGLWYLTGYDQQPIIVKKHDFSQTTYTLGRKISMVVNAITSFSNIPLISIFYIGILILFFASSYSVYLIICRFYFHNILNGWTSMMASLWLLGGLIISLIGIVGVYLSKIFLETKQRPYTLVRKIYQKTTNPLPSKHQASPRIKEIS